MKIWFEKMVTKSQTNSTGLLLLTSQPVGDVENIKEPDSMPYPLPDKVYDWQHLFAFQNFLLQAQQRHRMLSHSPKNKTVKKL